MPLRIKCPTGHVLIVPDNRVGKELRCPRCDQAFIVPTVDKKLSRQTGKVPTASPSSSSLELGNLTTNQPPSSAPALEVPAASEPRAFPPRQPSADTRPVEKPSTPQRPVTPAPPKPTAPPSQPKARVTSATTTPPSPPPAAPPPAPPPVTQSPPAIPPAASATTTPAPPAALPPAAAAPPAPATESEAKEPPSRTMPTPPRAPAAAAVTPPQSTADPIALAPRKLPVKPTPQPTLQADGSAVAATAPPSPPSPPAPPTRPPSFPAPINPPQPDIPAPKHGVVHARDKRLLVYQLAAAVIGAAVFAMLPAVWDVVEYLRIPDSPYVARWAFLLLMMGLVQLAYGVYLIQIPDWATVWVITLYALAMAAVYAMVFGLTLITSSHGTLVSALQLQDKVAGGQAALWSVCVASLYTLLAFFAGRMSVRWRRAEQVLRSVGLSPGELPAR